MTIRTLLTAALAPALLAQVSSERLTRADREPQNWLTFSGSYLSQRYSTLDQVTPANDKNLHMEWVFQSRSLEKFEVTPLVVDGVMYITQPPNDVIDLDAATGSTFWTYSYRPSPETRV
jgi:alcohol dehydrogenase (cytochrome c)